MTWEHDFGPRERDIIRFMAFEHGISHPNLDLTGDKAQELLLAFEDSEEYQTAYRCRPLTAADFNNHQQGG